MALVSPIKRALGKWKQFSSGDIISYLFLGTGGAGGGTKVLLDNNTFGSVPGGNLVYSNTAASSAIANTTAETAFSIPSYTIPAGSLVAGSVIRIKLWGWYSTAAIAPTINAKIKLGGTTYLATGAVTSVALASNAGWFADCVLTVFSIGAGGTVDAQAYVEFSTAATTGLSVNIANPSTQVLDTTVSQAITVTVQWGTANASNTITLQNAAIYIENLSTAATAGTFLQIANNLSDLNNAATARANIKAGFVIEGSWANSSPADATTYYAGLSAAALNSTASNVQCLYIPRDCILKAAYVNVICSAATNESVSYNAYINSVATLISASTSTATNFTVSNAAMSLACTAGQTIFLQIVCPAWVTNPSTHRGTFIFYFE